MRRTMICGVTDAEEGRGALKMAVELSERLGLRLVLAHVAEGISRVDGDGDDDDDEDESVTMKANREGAARLVAELAAENGLGESVERRWAVGDPGELLGQIAAEEAADLILVGARSRGRLRRGLESRLADQLERETPLPVLIAPPPSRARR
jgi:nucleotide-binding universal stress UspA family protein